MSEYYEKASANTKSFDWSKLPEGEYKVIGGDIVRVDAASSDVDRAFDKFLRKLSELA
ncbi:hypothetical protein QA645_17000 [Bradyrhizobium sp. CIAT3101]|uniref:hypothetical protein n=1 Tax=Bradyrhizobium sp. CIAT3101 TaxID=439387 RepID=UPI0024B0F2E2|nr:hypothetical protein [Bradyrhizobium sp. CIAT3101]WFU84370.1 hypothetical protein QA645_17000 [Bradyrhizobium sp. CIAT3101]